MNTLKLNNISKTIKGNIILKNLSLELSSGKIYGFVGPNGAGKTTTLKIMAGINKPSSGKIIWNDKEVTAKKNLGINIGFLPENNPLYTSMFVYQYLEFIGNLYHLSKVRLLIEEYLTKTALISEVNKRIAHLSKGNKQRLGLAAALLIKPQLLLLDEPTAGLDPNQIVDIRNLIKEEVKDKIIFFSSHLINEIIHLCEAIFIINSGEIVDKISIDNTMTEESLTQLFQAKTLN